MSARRSAARKGQRHLPGLWWSFTVAGHVGYESWLERDQAPSPGLPHFVLDVERAILP
jgi:hypothetical protein